MKKLSKEQLTRLAALRVDFEKAKHSLETVIEETNGEIENLNDKIQQAINSVEDARVNMNEKIVAMDALREEVAADIQSYMDDRSDTWAEGERGQAYQEWVSTWETNLEEVEVEFPEEWEAIEVPEFPDLDDALPLEPSQ